MIGGMIAWHDWRILLITDHSAPILNYASEYLAIASLNAIKRLYHNYVIRISIVCSLQLC